MDKDQLDLIKEFEGLRIKAYPDPGSRDGNPWTIGYGHTGYLSGQRVKAGDVISEDQAVRFLENDLKAVDLIIDKYVTTPINANQRKALRCFVFNIGETQFKKSSVLKYINEGRLAEVPGRMALYRMNDGKVMSGLVRRRTAEGALWMKPIVDVVEVQPTGPATPATPRKPWDWGLVGAFITYVSTYTDEVKKALGELSSALGISPILIVGVLIAGFVGWSIWSRWKDK